MSTSLPEIEWTPKARAVLAAASELFYERGIHAVGVDAVAERAGVTKKTLYDRFGSKERLVVEYLRARDQEWRALVAERLDAVGQDPLDRLAAYFDASAAWAHARAWKGCGMINAHAEISDPGHPAYAVIVAHKRWTLGLLRGLVEAAGVGGADADSVADHLMLLHEGVMAASGIGVPDDAFARGRDAAVGVLSRAARAARSGS